MDGNKWTPEERVKRTVLLAKDVERVRKLRRELMAACSAGARFNTFLKQRGFEPAAWEGLVAALVAVGTIPAVEKNWLDDNKIGG